MCLIYILFLISELPRQDEENSTEDMVACNDVGRPTRQKKRFSKNHTKENSQTENASQESQVNSFVFSNIFSSSIKVIDYKYF